MEAILFVILFCSLIGSIQPVLIPTSKNVLNIPRLSTTAPVNPELTTTVNHSKTIIRKQRRSEAKNYPRDCEQGVQVCFYSASKVNKTWQGTYESCTEQGCSLNHFDECEHVPKCKGRNGIVLGYSEDVKHGKLTWKTCEEYKKIKQCLKWRSRTWIGTTRNSPKSPYLCFRLQGFDSKRDFDYVCVEKNEGLNETKQNQEPPYRAIPTLDNEPVSTLRELEKKNRILMPSADEIQRTALLFSKASVETDFAEVDANSTANIIDQVLLFATETLIAAQKKSNTSTCFLTGLEHILTNPNLSNITFTASGFRSDATDLTGSPSLLYTCGGLKGSFNDTRIVRNPSALRLNGEHDVTVTFNVSKLKTSRAEGSTVAFLYHPTLRLADAALAAKLQYADVYHVNESNADNKEVLAANYTAFSGMVQVGIRGVYKLSEPVNLYFRPLEPVNMSSSSISIICVFWDPKVNDDKGGWSTYGCWYQGIVKGLVHCQCNHFSAFTALYAYGQETTDTVHDKILNWLTLIGCALSLLGLVGVISAYVIVPKCRVRRPGFYGHHLLFQQSLSLAAFLITFLSGFDKTENSVNCMFVAALLHYFMLVVFFWMLMEAYYYYCLFVKVRGINTSSFMLKACLFAWLVPCLAVVTFLSMEQKVYSYTNGKYCWLTPQGFYYTLLPVVAIITVINLLVYVLIIVKVSCRNSKLCSTQQPHKMSPHMAVAIFFLLGLSWTFGLLAIGEVRTFFSYLFCIFNSLQGSVMFLLFFYRGRVAQQKTETL